MGCQHDQHAQGQHQAPLVPHKKHTRCEEALSMCFGGRSVAVRYFTADAANGHVTRGQASVYIMFTYVSKNFVLRLDDWCEVLVGAERP